MSGKMKTSSLWSYFTISDKDKKCARCDLCGQTLCYKTTISNLKKHLNRKHPTIIITETKAIIKTAPSTSFQVTMPPVTPSSESEELPSSKRIKSLTEKKQISLEPFMGQRKLNETQKKKIDKLLLKLFTDDLQPFSIVEDTGFVNFTKALNPLYTLPSRKLISQSLIPAQYEQCLNIVRQKLVLAESVCLTTDIWTSKNTDSYLAITAHFIDDDFGIKSVLLQCTVIPFTHTSIHLAEIIRNIIIQFHLTEKVIAVITDNANNIKSAIVNELGWKHFSCFAHTLNLIVQDALKIIKELQEKVKTIVSFYKKSVTGAEKLNTAQINLGMSPKKLIQEVPTRWNSTFYMFERFVELQNYIKTATALINKDIPTLTEEEWNICKELCIVLKPFEQVTAKISGEHYVTGSQVIIFTRGLISICHKMVKEKFNIKVVSVLQNLQNNIHTRLKNIEYSKTIGLTTLLDPRFKLSMFTKEDASKSIKEHCLELMAKYWREMATDVTENQEDLLPVSEDIPKEKFSFWDGLDEMIASRKPVGTKTSAAIVELNRYLEEEFPHRNQDPLLWWKQKHVFYPIMTKMIKRHFNVLATSVPCERIFSKAGYVVNERRTRLSGKNVEKLLFLNVNSYLLD